MTKKSMKVKYKPIKREKNKINNEQKLEDQVKSFVYTFLGVLGFILVCYLGVLGMNKLGVFERRYNKPQAEEAVISYEYIPMGTVLNRNESTYYVLFDNYTSSLTEDAYVNSLLKDQKTRVYKVDMGKSENKKYIGETPNKKIKSVNDIIISDVTLMKVTNGKAVNFIVGSEKIEEYLK